MSGLFARRMIDSIWLVNGNDASEIILEMLLFSKTNHLKNSINVGYFSLHFKNWISLMINDDLYAISNFYKPLNNCKLVHNFDLTIVKWVEQPPTLLWIETN